MNHSDTMPSAMPADLGWVVARLEHAQRHELVDDFVHLFRHDAVWVTAHGQRLLGRDEIAAFTSHVLPGAHRDSTATYRLEHVVMVRPDVAVLAVRQRPVTLHGEPVPAELDGDPTYVVARGANGWEIVAGQNTKVPN